MTAESKKLQTSMDDMGFLQPISPLLMDNLDAAVHDAGIAHDQREVIRQLVEAIQKAGGSEFPSCRAAIAAAAPFLED